MKSACLRFALAAVAVMAVFAVSPSAQAQNIASLGPCGFGTWYNMYTLDRLPYFAMHPPVYYSYPVPRPYGWSPFAYSPNVMTPYFNRPAEPQVMLNPYVPRDGKQPAADKTASAPLVIRNPFVTTAGEKAAASVAARPQR